MQPMLDAIVKHTKPTNKPTGCNFMCSENLCFGSTGRKEIAVRKAFFWYRATTIEVQHYFWIRF
ncbi:hypothetical protein MCEMSEM22_02733 [Comamonadaceae bacterium]